jgi:methanogenic corrinoid protein MtbC1
MSNLESLIVKFESALIKVNRIKAAEVLDKCYHQTSKIDLLEYVVVKSLESIGDKWEKGTVSLSQVYMSSVICENLIEQYLPKFGADLKESPRMAIAVLQDHHALGKRIVYSVLRAGGYRVLDFGQGLSIEKLVRKTVENQIEVLLISTLMLPSALKVTSVKEKLIAEGVQTKIVVGGAPFRLDSDLWKRVNADACGKNASDVIKTIQFVLKGEKNDSL